jgi:hypothetical protein
VEIDEQNLNVSLKDISPHITSFPYILALNKRDSFNSRLAQGTLGCGQTPFTTFLIWRSLGDWSRLERGES